MIPDAENSPSQPIDFIGRKFGLRGDGSFEWTACNEVTQKLTAKGSHDAVAWAMLVEGQGWYGRIGKEFSFGPSTVRRAEAAVEARLLGQMFDKLEGEKSWSGTCWRLLSGFEPPQAEAAEEREPLTPVRIRGRSTRPKPALDDALELMGSGFTGLPTPQPRVDRTETAITS
jgi:hypothetical protein